MDAWSLERLYKSLIELLRNGKGIYSRQRTTEGEININALDIYYTLEAKEAEIVHALDQTLYCKCHCSNPQPVTQRSGRN